MPVMILSEPPITILLLCRQFQLIRKATSCLSPHLFLSFSLSSCFPSVLPTCLPVYLLLPPSQFSLVPFLSRASDFPQKKSLSLIAQLPSVSLACSDTVSLSPPPATHWLGSPVTVDCMGTFPPPPLPQTPQLLLLTSPLHPPWSLPLLVCRYWTEGEIPFCKGHVKKHSYTHTHTPRQHTQLDW